MLTTGVQLGEGVYLDDLVACAAVVVGVELFVTVLLVIARPWQRRGKSAIQLGLFAAFACLTVVLLVPAVAALRGGDVALTALQVAFLAIQSPTLNSGAADVVVGATSLWGTLYYVLLSLCYVAMPVLAVLNVYDLLGHRFSRVRFRLVCLLSVHNRDVYAFSALGERALSLAKEALEEKDVRAVVLFANVSKADRDAYTDELATLDSPNVHCLSEGFSELAQELCDRARFRSCYLFAVSDDATHNVAKACHAIELVRGVSDEGHRVRQLGRREAPARVLAEHDVRLFVRVDSPDDVLVLDAANAKGANHAPMLPVKPLQDDSMAAISLLEHAPLYLALGNFPLGSSGLRPETPQTLDVLVIGSGRVAEAVILNVLWAGQMHNVRLRVTVADDNAALIRSRIAFRCPGLATVDGTSGDAEGLFRLSFIDASLRSEELRERVLEPLVDSEHLYVICALPKGDAANHEVALATRLYLLERRMRDYPHLDDPIIAALVRDSAMSGLISEQLDMSAKSYGIVTFGADLFTLDAVFGDALENEAQRLDKLYSSLYNLDESRFRGPHVDVDLVREQVCRFLPTFGIYPGDDPAFGSERIGAKPQIIYHSNLSLALHTAYKAWALGLDTEDGRRAARTARPPSAAAVDNLARAEHNRWWVLHLTYGFTYLDEIQRQHLSVRLEDNFSEKNRLRKLEPLKKHVLLCPYDDVWEEYVRGMSGFSYERRAPACDGGPLVVDVSCDDGSPAIGMGVQLVTEGSHLVVDEWVVEETPHVCSAVAPGRYLLHPSRACPGRRVGDDVALSIGPDHGPVHAVVENSGALVNTAVYDLAFVYAVWWEATNGVRS